MRGLGDAVLTGRKLVGDELWPDSGGRSLFNLEGDP